MLDNRILDVALTSDGDITLGFDGDLLVVRDGDAVAQELLFRLKTVRGDFLLEPECGCDLELLIGSPNSPQTGALMESYINRGLTHDGFLGGELKQITAVPLSPQQLACFCVVQYGETSFTQSAVLDLREGIL